MYMKLINLLIKSDTLYYLYKLKPGDSIIYQSNKNYNRYYAVISGAVLFKNITSKNKHITLGIVNNCNIINFKNCEHSLFEIEAITLTYVLTYKCQYSNLINKRQRYTLTYYMKNHTKQLEQYKEIIYILSHKFIKNRFIQLIFYLSLEFGIIKNDRLTIPLYINKQQISLMIGSSRTNINKIIRSYRSCIHLSNKKNIYIKNIINLTRMHLNAI